MIPQSVAMRDAIKPEVSLEAQKANAVANNNRDKVDLSQRARLNKDKSQPISLDKAVKKSNEMAQVMSSQVRFQIHQETGSVIVKVVNKETGDVIRQIPSEEMIELSSKAEELRGLIFNDEG